MCNNNKWVVMYSRDIYYNYPELPTTPVIIAR